MDLDSVSREELLRIIAQQQAMIAEQQALIKQLEARIRELEARLSKGGPKGMPGLKPESAKPPKPKKPRKKRPHGFARLRHTKPTQQVIHAVDHCPKCNTRVMGGSVKRRREVIEIPVSPVQVTEHVFIERKCPLCQERLVPKNALGGTVLGKQRLGVNIVSLITTLKEEARLPIRTIQWFLEMFHQLRLSVGEIIAVIKRVAESGKDDVGRVRDKIRSSEVVLADETGWREDGVNGYVWTFSTDTERYFVRRDRSKEVVKEVLGEEFDGVLVSDFYASYNHYPGLHQRCWAHLLRDIHELKSAYPDDKRLAGWAKAVHKVYKQAKGFTHPKERERLRARQHFENKMLRICRRFLKDESAVQRQLCLRIRRFLSELFVFVSNPEVPADNNGAERSLRHLVISRKISGGTRSAKGTEAKMTLASLFGTWRARGLNPFHQCRQLLISPQL